MPSMIILSVAAATAVYVFLQALAYFTHDPKEPEAIIGTIPFISPLIGMLTQKGHYYVQMRYEYRSILAARHTKLYLPDAI